MKTKPKINVYIDEKGRMKSLAYFKRKTFQEKIKKIKGMMKVKAWRVNQIIAEDDSFFHYAKAGYQEALSDIIKIIEGEI